jgi:iron complex outermembrane receptor protein
MDKKMFNAALSTKILNCRALYQAQKSTSKELKKNLFLSNRVFFFKHWDNKKYAVFNSLHRLIKVCTLVCTYSIITKFQYVKGQEVDSLQTKITALDEIVVQSSLFNLKTKELGRQVEVIRAPDIQNAPVSSLDELFRYLPNVEVQSRGSFGNQSDISIRGANFNQMLVLIDGHKINDPLSGHYNSNIPVSLSEIDRIEVIYGPATSEYGPDAMGGVINIITRTFIDSPVKKKFSANGKLLTGQYNLITTDPGFLYSTDKFSLCAEMIINRSDGNPLESGLKNYFNNQTYSASLSCKISNKFSISYRYSYDHRDFNAQWYYSSSPFDSAKEMVIRNRHHIQIVEKSEHHITTFSASYLTTDDNYYFNSKSTATNYTSLGLVRLTHKYILSNRITSLIGIESNQRIIESNNRGNHNLWHNSAFLLLNIHPIEPIIFNPSVRCDYDELNNLYFLPQLSISYSVSPFMIVRSALGKSLRLPDYTELYYNNYASAVSPLNRLGNPALKAESSWNYEIGTDVSITPNLKISSTLFYRNIKNQIDYIMVNSSKIQDLTNLVDSANYWRSFNNSNVDTWGIDLRLIYKKFFSQNISSSITLGYSFADVSTKYDSQPLYLLLHSKHLINGTASFHLFRFEMNLNTTFRVRESSEYIASINKNLKKSYSVWNYSADYNCYNNNLFLNFTVYNLFNIKYSDFLGAEMPGRWFAAGLKFLF